MSIIGTLKNNPSVTVLIIANLFPVVQVLYFGLDVFPLVFLFWIETMIIGILNIPKLIFFHRWKAIGVVPFFIIHFGGFMFVHLMFIIALFLMKLKAGETYVGPLSDSSNVIAALFDYVHILWISIAVLALSHIFSFFTNYIGRKEYLNRDKNKDPMMLPYGRVILMHLVLLVGGFVVTLLGQEAIALFALIVLKVLVDIRGHIEEHKQDPSLSLLQSPDVIKGFFKK
ncbi:MAG: hypothetical protein RJB39_666 [Candidatus Parcubacteria bacterium]|jgi:hypothetical protein